MLASFIRGANCNFISFKDLQLHKADVSLRAEWQTICNDYILKNISSLI